MGSSIYRAVKGYNVGRVVLLKRFKRLPFNVNFQWIPSRVLGTFGCIIQPLFRIVISIERAVRMRACKARKSGPFNGPI
jgi:hypothetical protein